MQEDKESRLITGSKDPCYQFLAKEVGDRRQVAECRRQVEGRQETEGRWQGGRWKKEEGRREEAGGPVQSSVRWQETYLSRYPSQAGRRWPPWCRELTCNNWIYLLNCHIYLEEDSPSTFYICNC